MDGDEPEAGEHSAEAGIQRTMEEGRERLQRGWSALVATAVVGGVDVAFGVLGFLLVKHLTGSDVLAGLAFTIGFVALTLAKSELFTENFLVPVVAVVARRASLAQLLRLWGAAFFCNLLGGWLLAWLFMSGFPDLHQLAVSSGAKYIGYGLGWRAFALALLAGAVITLMTWMQHATDSLGGRVVAAVIAAFLLGAGALDHAIVASLVMFCALTTGHAPFGYLAWFESALWAALGNLIGGLGLVTLFRLLQVPHRLAEYRHAGEEEAARRERASAA